MFDPDSIRETIVALTLAIIGGLARILSLSERKRLKPFRVVSELFISGFTGVMVLLLCQATLDLHGEWLGLICGMAGWAGTKILDLISTPVFGKIGLEMKDTDSKKK